MRSLKDDYVSAEHVLLALARDDGRGPRADRQRRDAERLLQALADVRGRSASPTRHPRRSSRRSSATAAISPRPPRDGKLDPVIGRDEEIRRVIQVLSRRTKNNPV